MGLRLQKRWKELDLGDHDIPVNLDECQTLCHDLKQYDPDAVRLPTLKELEEYQEGEAGPVYQLKLIEKSYLLAWLSDKTLRRTLKLSLV